MTSIGALTTAFTAPASCASSTGIHIVACGTACVWWAEGPINAPSCYPPSYDPSLGNYYSPGVCPSGYTPACTSRRTAGDVTETIQTCCPTALGYTYHCDQPTFSWQSSLGCNVYMSDASSTFSFPTVTSIRDGGTVVTSTARTEVGIGAYGVEIRFQAADFGGSTASETTTGSSLTSTSPPATDTTTAATGSASSPAPTDGITDSDNTRDGASNSPNDSNTTTSNSSSGISPAASAGIGVGAAIGTLLILGLGIFFGRRSVQRRRHQKDAETRLHAADYSIRSPSEYKSAVGSGGGYGAWYELPPAPERPKELAVTRELAELQGRGVVHELGPGR